MAENFSDELLWKNDWLEARLKDGWYNYIHSARGGVCILGYRTNGKTELKDFEFLIRKEHNPAHQGAGLITTSLTGSIDEGYDPLSTAKKELMEESGYFAIMEEFVSHGWVYPLKSTDYKLNLFSINLDGKIPGEIVGDGTLGEKDAGVFWGDIHAACELRDPHYSTIIARMLITANK